MTFTTPHAFARTDRSRFGQWWWTTDHWLLGSTIILIGLGVMLSFAASPAAAARIGYHDPFHFAVRQCVFAAGGLTILLSVSTLSSRGVRRVAFIGYGLSILVMMVLPLMGHERVSGRLRMAAS